MAILPFKKFKKKPLPAPGGYTKAFAGFLSKPEKDEKKGGYTKAFAGFFGKKDKVSEEVTDQGRAVHYKNIHEFLNHPMTGDLRHHTEEHASEVGSALERHYTFEKPSPGLDFGNPNTDAQHNQFHKRRQAINNYTDNSATMNRQLITGEELGGSFKSLHDGMRDVTSVHTTPHDIHVFTGIKFDPQQAAKTTTSEGHLKLHLPAFTSTSLDPGKALQFAKDPEKYPIDYDTPSKPKDVSDEHSHMLVLHVPAGSHGAQISEHSNYPEENEFTLANGAAVHLHPVPHTYKRAFGPNDPMPRGKISIWHGHLVHDGFKPVSDKYEG